MLCVQTLQALPSYVGVYLGCRQISVAEEHLDRTQVSPVVEQVGGKRMAQGMRGDMLLDPRSPGVVLDPMPESLTR
jgi:hypothetical protein